MGSIAVAGRRGAWNHSRLHAFEVQTNSIKSEVERCVERSREGKYQLTFVTNSSRVKVEIERQVGNAYKVIKIKPYKEYKRI